MEEELNEAFPQRKVEVDIWPSDKKRSRRKNKVPFSSKKIIYLTTRPIRVKS
jgi:hypothetical protein